MQLQLIPRSVQGRLVFIHYHILIFNFYPTVTMVITVFYHHSHHGDKILLALTALVCFRLL